MESDKAAELAETGGASDWAHREVNSLINAPVGGLLPSTSFTSTIPCSPRLDRIQTTTRNSPLPATIGKRVSPFLKFSTNSPVQGDNSATSPASKKRNTEVLESPPITATSPRDVGEAKLERVLVETAEEAGNKVLSWVTNREEHSGLSSPDGMESPQATSKAPKNKASSQGTKSRGGPNDNSSGSDSSFNSESSSGLSSVEEMESPDPKTSKCKKQPTTTMSTYKRAKPRYVLAGWMYHKYPILKFFATAPTDAARYPHKYRCRVCLVELSLMTKGPIEILHHYRTDAHLIKEHRIRMETPGLSLFDRDCKELCGMALKYAKDSAKRDYPVAPKLGDYYLRIGQQDQTEATNTDDPSKEILSQLNLLKIGLMRGGSTRNNDCTLA